MRRALPVLVLVGTLLAFFATVVFLYQKSRAPEVVFETAAPLVTDIVKKTVATGSVVPRNEVLIKPRVSGVLERLVVEPGAVVQAGDLLATVRIIPDSVTLGNAGSAVRQAQISLEDAKAGYERDQGLATEGAISTTALRQSEVAFRLRQAELRAAQDHLRLVREGAARGSGELNTEVRATVGGTVLAVPVKVGASVIESNTFNEGTTIAIVADMRDLIFQGKVDESEVGRIKEGMPLEITVGALEDRTFSGTLEHIAPRGEVVEGAVQFEIRAAIIPPDDAPLRAGMSANADIVLDQRKQVLAIEEAVLLFEGEKPYVEVEVAAQTFERRDVEVGLSDGIHVEVRGGVTANDRLKKPAAEG